MARYTPSVSQSIATADLNGDGLLDLVAVNSAGVQVFFGQSDGGLSPPTSYNASNTQYASGAIGDVNGDGFPDVVRVSRDQETIEIFLNDGKGNLALQSSLDAGTSHSLLFVLAIGDLNSDGHADLVVECSADTGGLEIAVLFGSDSGDFGSPVTLPGISAGWGFISFALGDLNQDGLPDIVADTTDGSLLAVLINQGDGGFSSTLYTTPALGEIVLLPRKGAPDLVLGAGGYVGNLRQGIQLLRNSGDGTFTVGPSYSVPGGQVLEVGDFNGDCIPDIASSYVENCNNVGTAMGVLFGDGDGGFSDPVSLQGFGNGPASLGALGPVENPRALAVGDLCGAGIAVYGDASR